MTPLWHPFATTDALAVRHGKPRRISEYLYAVCAKAGCNLPEIERRVPMGWNYHAVFLPDRSQDIPVAGVRNALSHSDLATVDG